MYKGPNVSGNTVHRYYKFYNQVLPLSKVQESYDNRTTLNYQLSQAQTYDVVLTGLDPVVFGITEKTIKLLKKADGLVVGSAICKEITRSIKKRQNTVTNVTNVVKKLKNKIK